MKRGINNTIAYLSGSLVHDTIRGIQSAGVIASVKHFIGNEQEYHRNPLWVGQASCPNRWFEQPISDNFLLYLLHKKVLLTISSRRAGGAAGGIGGASGLGSAAPGGFNQTVESLSTNIDDKTMHELYLWPFVDAVHAGSASVMCSYQRINNSYGCHNQKTQNGILKKELGFEGFVVSDWGAQR